jgi:omega-3 fatty acid desaturase (delta-15 desaturase)
MVQINIVKDNLVDNTNLGEITPTEKSMKASTETSKYIKLVGDEELEKIDLAKIRKALPKDVFVKSAFKSLLWMAWDMSVSIGLHYLIYQLYLRGYYLVMLPLFVLCGFFMWCVFVVGHDCGHGTFSNSKLLNTVCGMLTHCSILVPFQAWARSHRFHHLNHNHHQKDYSFPWVHNQAYDSSGVKFLDRHPTLRAFIYPIFGYFIYLNLPTTDAGGIDGNHYFPHLLNQKFNKLVLVLNFKVQNGIFA